MRIVLPSSRELDSSGANPYCELPEPVRSNTGYEAAFVFTDGGSSLGLHRGAVRPKAIDEAEYKRPDDPHMRPFCSVWR